MHVSIFDIIGPIMIGPSSSHTAGASRLGNLAAKRLGAKPVKAAITLYNSFAETAEGHGTRQALLSGIMEFPVADERLKDGMKIAKRRGLKYNFQYKQESRYHPNSVRIELFSKDGRKASLLGASLGGGRVRVWDKLDNGRMTPEKFDPPKESEIKIDSFSALREQSVKLKKSIVDLVIEYEARGTGKSKKEIREMMRKSWEVMKIGAETGIKDARRDRSDLFGGDARRFIKTKTRLISKDVRDAMSYAIAMGERNVRMGRVVAAPTSGSCGIVPGCLMILYKNHKIKEQKIINSLFLTCAIGMAIVRHATVAGAEGGCQAECGSAVAMAAAAITYIFGGTNKQIDQAAALSLANLLGLVCDPIMGYVAVPCIMRNGLFASSAISAAETVLAKIKFVIPFDEVIETMDKIGKCMPVELRETSRGGLAVTKTGKKYGKILHLHKSC